MKTRFVHILAACALCLAACAPTKESLENSDAERQLLYADSLEVALAIPEAAAAYAAVAGRFPNSDQYPRAVKKAAYLYCSPLNSEPDDSLALKWFRVYASLPIPADELTQVHTCVSLLSRIEFMKRAMKVLDAAVEQQATELINRSNAINELNDQLKKTADELTKLKEIDVEAHKRGTKK